MRLYFKGPYTNDDRLPHEEIKKHPTAEKFKEFENTKQFLLLINLVSFIILAVITYIYHKITGLINVSLTGIFLVFASMIPHEYIHASFFRRRTYIYFHQYALMITGTEPMSKTRFISMCVTPSIVFGFIPFILYLLNPQWTILGTFGGISLSMCLGDFYNAYHCLTQVPSNGLCFMNKQNTYWFIPDQSQRLRKLRPTVIDKLFGFVSVAMIIFIYCCGMYGVECVGLVLQVILYELTLYSLIAYLQIQDS